MGEVTPSGEVLKGFLEEVMKVLQAWKRLEVVSQKLDGGLLWEADSFSPGGGH